ncbi:MAG: universal stress protein [Verrucomicrobia bacterium]|nr:universal stress protein [Verrucomicrobiota bacterium]
MKTILAPIDFSPASSAVLTQATALARSTQARLILLSVVQPPLVTSDYGPLVENMSEIIAAAERSASERLEKVRTELLAEVPVVETELAGGAPVQAIADAAKRFQADYIVMGSHGHTALYDLVIGSTTHGVLKRAKCPVLIIPAS